jgi:hypothetical protein
MNQFFFLVYNQAFLKYHFNYSNFFDFYCGKGKNKKKTKNLKP